MNEAKHAFNKRTIAHIYDTPPWMLGLEDKPRLAGLRWKLRRVAPWLVW